MVRSSSVQICPDTRYREGDLRENTAFGDVDEQEEKIEKFERMMGEQKKKLDIQQKVIEEQSKKLSRFERMYEDNEDLELAN